MALKLVGNFPVQPDRVWCAAPHPHLPLVATASTDRAVRIYSLRDFSLVSTIEGGHKRSVRSISWKPNAKGESVLATGSFDSSTGIWHREERGTHGDGEQSLELNSEEREEDEEWRFAVVLDGHDSEVKSVAWSAGGSFLATCSRDKTVWIWEDMGNENYETIAVLQDHSQDVKMVAWHPEEELLASSSYDDTIRLYKEDTDDWVCCAVLTGHTSTVWSISFENNGHQSRLVSASDDQTARVWHRKPKPEKKEEEEEEEEPSMQPPSIIKGTADETENWEEQACLPKVHTRTIYSVDWSKKTGLIATAGGDGRIVLYKEVGTENGLPDADSGASKEWKVIAQVPAAHGVYEINSVTWCPKWDKLGTTIDGELLLSTGDDGIVNIFEFSL
ncbi:Cytosolic iron-sulfur protein assembly protein [Orbilia oligospora]|uniref:Probable cytosolic iron-sulfur protein assembly protein 1 n=1 Tax=Orbilia oligospora TaxID=2813651 RepID=A0A7C8VFU2_ORBOL|nr:Cytosolic iron-sulfur protein assembly protein [Orbilia oligospora]